MSGPLPEALVGLALLTLLARVAWTDVRERRIANRACLAIVALWPVYLAVAAGAVRPVASIQVALAVLAVGALLWGRGWLGGGDVKLLAAVALWAGPSHVLTFLLVTGLAGGVLAVAILWHAQWGLAFLAPLQVAAARLRLPVPALGSLVAATATPTLPYGVAIALGGAVTGLRLIGA